MTIFNSFSMLSFSFFFSVFTKEDKKSHIQYITISTFRIWKVDATLSAALGKGRGGFSGGRAVWPDKSDLSKSKIGWNLCFSFIRIWQSNINYGVFECL